MRRKREEREKRGPQAVEGEGEKEEARTGERSERGGERSGRDERPPTL